MLDEKLSPQPESPATLTYGGKSANARTVLVYGNCQAPYLGWLLSSLDDLNDDYRFVYAPSFASPWQAKADCVPDIHLRDVALVLSQFEKRTDNPAGLALRALLPPGCPVITFPTLLMTSLWPFECPEPRDLPDRAYPWKRYPNGDRIGLQIAQTGLSGALAVAAYLDLSAQEMPDLQLRLQRDIERMHNTDAQCEVKLADYVEANFRDQHLFWTYSHPSEAGAIELARRVAAVARPLLGGSAVRMEQCLASLMGFKGLGEQQVPIHPAVAQALGLRFWTPDQTYRWYSQEWNFYEYIERYIAYDSSW